MKKTCRKQVLAAGLLLLAVLALAPVSAQAKKAGKDKGVALTEKNFPDVLYVVREYDKDGDGYLSKKEQAAVTSFACETGIKDFSQLRYFTNLKSLYLAGPDWGVWIGNEADLTCFPKLEKVEISLDTQSWRAEDMHEVRITVSGLRHLKELQIYEYDDGVGDKEAVRNIDVLDLRDTPALKRVAFGDAKGVIFDDGAKLEKLALYNVPELPLEQIEKFTTLKELTISTRDPGFTKIDLSKLRGLTRVVLAGPALASVDAADARALEKLEIWSDVLRELDLSENAKLRDVWLKCPSLEELHMENSAALESLVILSERLTSLDLKNHAALTRLAVYMDELETLDVSKNKALNNMRISSENLETLDLSKNTALVYLHISAKKLETLDLGKNSALKNLRLETEQLKALNTAKNKKLNTLRLDAQALTKLDLAKNKRLKTLVVSAPGLTALDLSANTKLWELGVKNTSLAELKLPGLENLCYLTVEGNKRLEVLDVSESPALYKLTVRGNALTSLELLGQTQLDDLAVIGEKKLTALEMAANANLYTIVIRDTALRSLALPKQSRLRSLAVVGNSELAALDLSKLPKLLTVVITDNAKLTELDFSNKSVLYEADLDNNPLRKVTFGKVPNMAYLFCQNTALAALDLSGATREDLVVYCDEGVKVTGYAGTVHTEAREPDEDRYSWWASFNISD